MNRMRKVLIADDEVKVGQLVKRLIQWDRLGLTCIGLVTDGQTAYEKILSESPDIVITDIRMPVLTGLEMIQKASEQGVKCHFIVVSGYKYFDYAQKALKYGVEDYLLKPIDEDELNRQLQKIVAEEEQREDKQQQVNQIEKKLEDSKYLRHKEFLRQILSQKQENIDAANTEFGLQLENKCFRGLTFKLDRDIDVAENTQQMQFVLRKIMQKAEDAFSACTIDLIAAVQSNHSVQVLLNYFQTEQENIDNRITDFFNELSDYLENFQHYRITVGVSSEVESFEQISTAIEMSKEAAASRLFKGNGRRIEYCQEPHTLFSPKDFQNEYEEFAKAVETMQPDACQYQIHKCFRLASDKALFASEFYAMGLWLLRSTYDILEIADTFDVDVQQEVLENLSTVADLRDYVIRQVQQLIKESRSERENRERKPVLEAIAYMKEHFTEKITLEDVAATIGFNTNYFSELFKKETGENFSNYLLGIRMEKAKQMLRDTKIPVYEIGESVGCQIFQSAVYEGCRCEAGRIPEAILLTDAVKREGTTWEK